MTLADRIKLIDDMIRENADVTIKEYVELCKELRAIQAATDSDPVIILKKVENDLIGPDKKKRKPRFSNLDKKYLRTYKIR